MFYVIAKLRGQDLKSLLEEKEYEERLTLASRQIEEWRKEGLLLRMIKLPAREVHFSLVNIRYKKEVEKILRGYVFYEFFDWSIGEMIIDNVSLPNKSKPE